MVKFSSKEVADKVKNGLGFSGENEEVISQDRFSPVGRFTNERYQDYLPAAKSSTALPIAPTGVFVEFLPWEE